MTMTEPRPRQGASLIEIKSFKHMETSNMFQFPRHIPKHLSICHCFFSSASTLVTDHIGFGVTKSLV